MNIDLKELSRHICYFIAESVKYHVLFYVRLPPANKLNTSERTDGEIDIARFAPARPAFPLHLLIKLIA
jgi:hypothetical protein